MNALEKQTRNCHLRAPQSKNQVLEIGKIAPYLAKALYYSFLLLLLFPPARLFAQLPSQHERWIGTWEEESGKGQVYDFRFRSDGELRVEKSTGTELLKQNFTWTAQGPDLQIRGDHLGAIPELSDARLIQAGEQRYLFTPYPGETIQVRRSFTVVSWLHAAFLFCIVFLGNELCRRYRLAPYIVYFVLPIVLIPIFLHSGFDSVFRWTKLYSAVVGAVFFTIFRFHGLHRFRWAKIAVAVILAVNILEACTQDFNAGHVPNLLNACAGLLNIVTISRWCGLKRDEATPHDMLWPGMTTFWIVAYDIWNITFVYLNFPNTVLFTMIIVIAPTLAAFVVKKGTWMQARAYTLAIYMIYIFSLKAVADHFFNLQFTLPLPRSGALALLLALLSLSTNLIYAILHFRWRFTGSSPTRLEIGQSESVL